MESFIASFIQALLSGLSMGSLYALIALGYSLTFVVNGTLNMSQGQLVMLGAMLMLTFTSVFSIPFFIALVLTGIIVAIVGILLERISIRKFAHDKNSVSWILSTLALGIIIQDLALFFWGPEERLVKSPVGDDILRVMGAGVYWKELIMLPAVVIFLVLLTIFYKKSHWGMWLRATADNRLATNLMGINSNYIVAIAFGLSGLLAGIGGGLISPVYAISVAMGLPIGLKAIAVAIIGGLNSTKGIVIAGFGIGLAEVLVATFISTELKQIIIYLLVIAILLIKPTGLFGTKSIMKV